MPKSAHTSFSGKLPPRKPKNVDVCPQEYLTEAEMERLMDAAASQGRHGHRDAAMILLAFRHGLRVSELIALRWDMVDLDAGLVHVTRFKHGVPSSHPLRGVEIRALRRVKRKAPQSPYVFVTERESPMTDSNFRNILARAGKAAGVPFPVHPHMLRHATGFKLANDAQDTRAIQHYLGHKNMQHTVRYTELNANRFVTFWKD